MALARQTVAKDISRNIPSENTSHSDRFSWAALSRFSPRASGKTQTSEENVEGSNRNNPSSRKEKKT